MNCLFNVTINDISVIYVTAHRCAGGLKKKLDLRSGSQRHRHFVGFFNVSVLAPTRDHPFYTVIPTHRPFKSPFTITLGIRRCTFSTQPPGPSRGYQVCKIYKYTEFLDIQCIMHTVPILVIKFLS